MGPKCVTMLVPRKSVELCKDAFEDSYEVENELGRCVVLRFCLLSSTQCDLGQEILPLNRLRPLELLGRWFTI